MTFYIFALSCQFCVWIAKNQVRSNAGLPFQLLFYGKTDFFQSVRLFNVFAGSNSLGFTDIAGFSEPADNDGLLTRMPCYYLLVDDYSEV